MGLFLGGETFARIEELKKLDALDLLTLGLDTMRTRYNELTGEEVEKIGAVLGEIVGTIFLNRAITPEEEKRFEKINRLPVLGKCTKTLYKKSTLGAVLGALALPFHRIGAAIAGLPGYSRQLGNEIVADGARSGNFRARLRKDSAFSDLMHFLWDVHIRSNHQLQVLACSDGFLAGWNCRSSWGRRRACRA